MIKIKYTLWILFALSSFVFGNMQSAYSGIGIKNCKVVKSELDGYFSSAQCEKFADILVEVSDTDERQDMILIRDKKRYDLHFADKISSAFSYFGTTIEWRFKKGQKNKPFAMISRFMAADDYVNGMPKNISYLVVTKIVKDLMCIVGKIDPGKDQNVKARKMADRAQNMTCLKNIVH